MNEEPVLIANAIQAVLVVAVGLGAFSLTDAQQGLIMGAVLAVMSVIVRHKVTPVA